MGMHLNDMSQSQIEAAAERWIDHLYDLYYGTDEREEPWEHDAPDVGEILDLVDAQSWDWICDAVRVYIDGDADLLMAIYDAGLLDQWLRPERTHGDPEECWDEICRVMDQHANDDDLMRQIYKWMSEEQLYQMGEWLLGSADTNGIRELYNKAHEEDD